MVAVLMLVGAWPTMRLAGEGSIAAMLAGCGLSLIASLAGSVPIWRAWNKPPQETLPAMMGSIVLRFAAAFVLGIAAAATGWFATRPLLLWLAISYVGLLVADVRFARAQLDA